MRVTWPLTGRSEELQAIDAALVRDRSGIVVCGAAGVGKSRIAREALTAATARGVETRWAISTSSARALPLAAFNAWAPSGATETVHMVRGVIDSLTATTRGSGVIVGVDDVHLLDELSAFVLHQIVQRRAAKVVLTLREGEPVPDATQEIWRGGELERLDLQPLSLDETTSLVSAALGGPVDSDAGRRLWKLTHGNVLYLRNIVEQEAADGRLILQGGCWQWIGEPIVPRGLVELIEARIGALPSAVGDVLDTLAVGEPIELGTLRRITDPAAIEEADIRGLITLDHVDAGIEVRVAHPLYGEVRRRRAPSTRLRRLRGRVAAELANSPDSNDLRVVVRRATLSLDSDVDAESDLLIAAAKGAVWLADLSLAERLAVAAIRAGAGTEASFIRAHALSWLFRGTDAEHVLAGIDTAELNDDDRARLAFLRASNKLWALADPDGAKKLIDDASTDATPEAHRYLDAFLVVYWFAMDKPSTAIEASKSLAVDELPAVVGTEAAWALAVMSADAGQTEEAVALAESGYAVATRAFDAPHMRFNIADAHISALLLSGRVNDALEVADRVRREAADLPGAAQLLGAAIAGRAALGAGQLDTASALLERAAVSLSVSHSLGWGRRYQVPRATALAMRGSVAAATTTLDALDERKRPFRMLDYERSLARAWVAAARGAVSEAISIALAAAERAAADGRFAAEVMLLQTATQFGDRTTAPRLKELEAIVEGPRVGLAARFAAALRDNDAAELAAVSEDFERTGDLLASIDAAAHAAILYRSKELRGSSLACSQRAEELALRCGGVATPVLIRAAERLPLTDRELEIVMLIAEGLSSRAVAERLTLSVRTIEGHIYRAMTKTGTTSREELAALIPRLPDRGTTAP